MTLEILGPHVTRVVTVPVVGSPVKLMVPDAAESVASRESVKVLVV